MPNSLARWGAERAADEVGQHAAEYHDGQTDEGVVEAAFRGLDRPHTATSRHVLVAGQHHKEGAHDERDRRAHSDELGEHVDDWTGVHWGEPSRSRWTSLGAEFFCRHRPPSLTGSQSLGRTSRVPWPSLVGTFRHPR